MLAPLTWLYRRIRRLFRRPPPYAAIVLDPEAQMLLVRWWDAHVGVPLLKYRKCHHMTIWFNPPKGQTFPEGLRTHVQIAGWAADERGQAVAVYSPDVESHNAIAHVTLAVAEGISAAYSNDLLARGITPLQGPKLVGTVKVLRD